MDLFRNLLPYYEKNCINGQVIGPDINLGNYSIDEICYHVELMVDEDLIKATDVSAGSDHYKVYLVKRLTYKGHEFLSALKNDTVWNKVKDTSKELGVEVIKSIIPTLISYVKVQLGLP